MVFAWLRERCNDRGQRGSVTVIHRFGSALRAHRHLHALVAHGTSDERADGTVSFLAAPVPTLAEVNAITTLVVRRVRAHLRMRGILEHDNLEVAVEPVLRSCAAVSVRQLQLLGPFTPNRAQVASARCQVVVYLLS